MTVQIETRQLGVSIGPSQLLTDISLTVAAGDYLCVVGPNGSGKSTLLRCLLGLQPYSAGQIVINGQPQTAISRKKLATTISYVPQSNGRNLPFTVDMFVKMARYPYHTAVSEWQQQDNDAVESALEMTATAAFKHRQMTTLSGGECQRVMIAAALCQQTPLMILDEPTSFLDPHHQVEVHRLIQRLNRQCGITIIEVSHDINHASQHSSHILALKAGRSMWQGESNDFLQTDLLQSLYQQNFVLLSHPQTGKHVAIPEEQL